MTATRIEMPVEGLAKRLKAETEALHHRVNDRVNASGMAGDRGAYLAFLKVQHQFHSDVAPLYRDARLNALLPDLEARRRIDLVTLDLADLGAAAPAAEMPPVFAGEPDVPTAIGWLYVAEGSTLGAGLLLKDIARIGLSETFGARHFAAHPDGRGRSWHRFTAALDSAPLSEAEEARAIDGAFAAFTRVMNLAETLLPLPAQEAAS